MSPVVSAIAMITGPRRSGLPAARSRWTTVVTSAAMTTEIELSGPATAKGSELRNATIAPPSAADRNVTATP